MIDFDPFQSHVKGLTETTAGHARARHSLDTDDTRTDEHRAEERGRLRREAEEQARVRLHGLRQAVAKSLAELKNPTVSGDLEERRYWAMRAQQELADARSDEALTIFERIVRDGSPVAIDEVGRVAAKIISRDGDTETGVRFGRLRRDSMPEDQRTALRDRAELSTFADSLDRLPGHITQLLDNADPEDADRRFGVWFETAQSDAKAAGESAVPQMATAGDAD